MMTEKEFSRRLFLKTSAAGLVATFAGQNVARSVPSSIPQSHRGFELHSGPNKGFFSIFLDGKPVIRDACVRVETEAGVISSFQNRFTPHDLSTGTEFHLAYADKQKTLDINLRARVCEEEAGLILEASVTNRSSHQVRVKSIEPIVAIREHGGGLRAWEDPSRVRLLTDEWERCYGAAGVVSLNTHTEVRSAWDIHIFEKSTARCFSASYYEVPNTKLSFAIAAHDDMRDADFVVAADTRAGSRSVAVPAGKTFRVHELVFLSLEGWPFENLCRYATLMARRNAVSVTGTVPVGWVDWYFAKATTAEEEIVRMMDAIAAELKDYGLEYIQIDSGWQIGVETTAPPDNVISGGPWRTNSRFPHGMKWLADRIRERGFRPGIWVRPFHVIDGADARMTHPGWFNEKGQMDFSHQEVREYVRRLFTMLVDDWGYEYIKYDFPSFDLFGAWGPKLFDDTGPLMKHVDQHATTIEAYRESLAVMRNAVQGKARLLACNSVMPPTLGLADVFRIGDDVGKWERIFSMGVKSIAVRFYTNGMYWWNDPDCLLVGEPLTLDQARAWASLIALTGGTVFISEDIRTLPAERMAIIKKVLPVFGVAEECAQPLDFLETSPPEIWNRAVKKSFGSWNVVGVFNWSDAEKEKSLNLALPGAKPETLYCVYEFWDDTYLGDLQCPFNVKLAPWASKVFALREIAPHPQIVSTSRHITQGGVDLDDERWDEQHATLECISRVVKHNPYVVSVRVPQGFRVVGVVAAERLDSVQERVLRVQLSSDETTTIPWSIRFERD